MKDRVARQKNQEQDDRLEDLEARVEARAIEAHICLDCGTIYDHPTVCGLNGADSPTVPVRDAIQSREPAPAVREEARVEAAEQRLTLLKFEVPQ